MSNQHQEDDHLFRSAWSLTIGLLLGGLAGAIALLLWAPQSGKKTRALIQDESIVLLDQVTETVGSGLAQARDKVDQIATAVRKQTKELEHRAQDLVDDQKDIASQVVADEKKAVQSAVKA